ncbi:MAG: glucan biosynthesis protein [Planctomycetota bacterium]
MAVVILVPALASGAETTPAASRPATHSAPTAEPDPVLDQLADAARRRAMLEYANHDVPLPPGLAALDYDGHRDIRCLPEDFLWHGTDAPYRVQFRHRGWLFKEEVLVSTVKPGGGIEPLPFAPERFTYGPIATENLDPATLPEGLGYAGIALHKVGFEKNEAGEDVETFNEFLSIQGASYFRAIGFGQHWGSSARGIAINTALPQSEEFPRWLELWIKQPAPDDTTLTLYGLLDGPSVSGAYKFVITPDQTTSMEVEARLHFRAPVDKLGLAPITSMFLFGEDTPGAFDDYRPEVHDADGLLMQHQSGELDWRPLRNPRHLAVSRFQMTGPAGFGLIQRDRNFAHYEDLETEMQIRPSIWVKPHAGFDEGWVELLEIASNDEGIDNIGAYWVPADESWNRLGGTHTLRYRIDFTQDPRPIDRDRIAWVATRAVIDTEAPEPDEPGSVVRTGAIASEGRPVGRFILDTEPDSALPSGTIVRSDVTVRHGKLVGEPIIQYNKFTHSYRLFFDVKADGEQPVELRATLRGATALDRKKELAPEGTYDGVVDPDTGPPLSENWLYRWDLP